MAIFNAANIYQVIVDVKSAVSETGVVMYWDDIANSGQLSIYASMDGGRSWAIYREGGLSALPATFATDFPNAIQISGPVSVT